MASLAEALLEAGLNEGLVGVAGDAVGGVAGKLLTTGLFGGVEVAAIEL